MCKVNLQCNLFICNLFLTIFLCFFSPQSPEPDNYSDTGSGTHYDDEDSDYDDDEGSGDVDSWDEGSDDDGVYDRGVYNKDTSAKQPPTNSLDNSDPSRNVRHIIHTALASK